MAFCPKCGQKNKPEAKFCAFCGASFTNSQNTSDRVEDKKVSSSVQDSSGPMKLPSSSNMRENSAPRIKSRLKNKGFSQKKKKFIFFRPVFLFFLIIGGGIYSYFKFPLFNEKIDGLIAQYLKKEEVSVTPPANVTIATVISAPSSTPLSSLETPIETKEKTLVNFANYVVQGVIVDDVTECFAPAGSSQGFSEESAIIYSVLELSKEVPAKTSFIATWYDSTGYPLYTETVPYFGEECYDGTSFIGSYITPEYLHWEQFYPEAYQVKWTVEGKEVASLAFSVKESIPVSSNNETNGTSLSAMESFYRDMMDAIYKEYQLDGVSIGSPIKSEGKIEITYTIAGTSYTDVFIEQYDDGKNAQILWGPKDAGGEVYYLTNTTNGWEITGTEGGGF